MAAGKNSGEKEEEEAAVKSFPSELSLENCCFNCSARGWAKVKSIKFLAPAVASEE